MASNSKIEWTDATWSPIRARVKKDAPQIAIFHGWKDLAEICERMKGHVGPHCEVVSSGCNHCYSCTNNHRCLPSNGTGLPFDKRSRELVDIFIDEKMLAEPLRRRAGKKIFVENQSDLFGEWVPFDFIDKVFAVMSLTPQHTYQILTKRPERMLEYVRRGPMSAMMCEDMLLQKLTGHGTMGHDWPLPNVWLGVSVEDQKTANDRIPLLLQTTTPVRFVSYEPALGPVDFTHIKCTGAGYMNALTGRLDETDSCVDGLDWIIVGGESGNGARPIHPTWVRSVRNQCIEPGVSFFFKQWGEWAPASQVAAAKNITHAMTPDGKVAAFDCESMIAVSPDERSWEGLRKLGKKKAGAVLDDREWREFPEARA